ncbi:MAG: TerB N-terminal domain-containing protein [Clostridia bacterium]|nr:TerB N-terminal domain-containing protein [Clostridia bacterium]
MENERKSPEELANLKKNIRKLVENITGEPFPENYGTASFEVDSLFTDGRKIVHDTPPAASDRDDDFWNLGRPKPRVYKKPDFSDSPVELTAVDNTVDLDREVTGPEAISPDARPAEAPVTRSSHSRLNYRPADNTDILSDLFDDLPERTPDETVSTVSAMNGMTIPERPKTTTATTSDGRQTIVHDAPPRYPTGSHGYGSYKRHGSFNPQKNAEQTERRKRHTGDEVLARYTPDGLLLREIEVRSWTSDIDFYERFLENAEKSHSAQSTVPYTSDYPRVSYFSYVPQYSHMSRAQLDFYRWVRENIRHGRYPDCDPSYIQLYIYEILNLPELIPPEYGAAQLAGIWLHYRRTEPRLDGYLCEWLPDYCMIHACPMPEKLKPLLPEIVPKAQFKEFYLDFNPAKAAEEDYLTLAKTFIEVSSDYDYRRSRYYTANRDAYEHHLPLAVVSVIKHSIANGNGVFARDKTYKMSRDSYFGAIVSISVKRRMNIEFCSFTRSAETRRAVTAIVKYAENKLRLTLGIKSKLGVDGILPEDSVLLDAYFAPMLPQKTVKPKEDQYMPEDYLKNYESEDSGFDFGAAAEIERRSWQNTTLLTQGEFEGIPELTESGEDAPDLSEAIPAPAPVEKAEELPAPELPAPENPAEHPVENSAVPEKADASAEDDLLREALSAALNGHFHDFCRDHQIYDGVLADRINTKFLDILGDIVLEENGKSYTIIEDYREDIETWMEE